MATTPSIASRPTLARGINVTNWFRYPGSRDPTALAHYIGDEALTALRKAGFDFVRLAVDPDMVVGDAPGAVLVTAIRRIQAHGMAVIVSPHPNGWRLETSASDRERLRAFWRELAPKLAALDQARTLPEVLNEPVFPNDPNGWADLQDRVFGDIRHALPQATIVLTGNDWGSIHGLLELVPETDGNVLYSVHFYDPPELTSLAAYRHDIDQAALTQLPFPVDDQAGCDAAADSAADPSTHDLMRYYCSLHWDADRVGASIGQAAEWASRHHVRLLAGEFGASAQLNPRARMAWLKTAREAFERRHVAWALWGYDDVMGFAVPRPPVLQPVLSPALLSALGMGTAK